MNSFWTITCFSKLTPKKKVVIIWWSQNLQSCNLVRDLIYDSSTSSLLETNKPYIHYYQTCHHQFAISHRYY